MSDLRVPNEGETVTIESNGYRVKAVVGKKAPNGSFSVSWWDGINRFSGRRGHWCTDFGPNGEPRYGWRIVAIGDDQ